jgi:hypothetical protein
MIALVAVAGSASAQLRSPQVVFSSASLQGYLNGQGESINVTTDQLAAQRWQSTVSNNSTFTIQAELAGNAGSNTYGLYNASGPPAPALYQLFPGAATTGWFAVASFRSSPTRVVVNLFDNTAALVGTNTYLGADKTNFGFYLSGPGGLFYTQDARNAGSNPQMLAFAGNGLNSGSFWLCFEDLPFGNSALTDFDDAILFCESINPTPVNKTSWGSLKARFH